MGVKLGRLQWINKVAAIYVRKSPDRAQVFCFMPGNTQTVLLSDST